MDYYKNYIIYKNSYLQLRNSINNHKIREPELDGGGQKYMCNYKNHEYKKICVKNNKGSYSSLDDCYKECDSKFITNQLQKANLHKETVQFYLFIEKLIKNEHMNIYIKGGNVIGLAVLKLIYDAYVNDNIKFKNTLNEFLKLELIKDWDFEGYTNNKKIDINYKQKLENIAKQQQLALRAKTFILYQTKKPILIYEKALYEIAILDSYSCEYSKMEIPMTTMKVMVNMSNIKYIYMMSKCFYSWKTKHIPIDLDIVKKILSQIEIIIHPHKYGYYDPFEKIDVGEINNELVSFIKKITSSDKYLTQFLITHMQDPYRLIYRFGKNIHKTKQIIDFIKKNMSNKKIPSWLLNVDKTVNVVNNFINKLGEKLKNIYENTESFDKTLDFLDGVNFGKPQIQIEWKEFDSDAKSRFNKIFEPLINKIGLDKFKNIIKSYKINNNIKDSELSNSDKIIKLFKFLIKNNVFD